RGTPALTRVDSQIDFDWGDGSPDPVIQTDGFSVRWTRVLNLPAGDYNFFTYSDDGVRLWVDGVPVIDEWHDQEGRQYVSARPLAAGDHTIRMEYYDRVSRAAARLGIVNTTAYPQPQQWEWGSWKGEYFDNRDLSGDPRMVRKDTNIDFDWGDGSPDPSIPADNFSVRWTASLFLKGGTYDFFNYTDDGVRLYVDGAQVINEWRDQGPTQFRSNLSLGEGVHFIRMEYYEGVSGATARLWWQNSTVHPQWRGEYFANKDLSDSPITVRNDANIDFDWPGSPADGVPHDGFSVRWTGVLNLDAGTYTFDARVDDGVRLWVDGFQGLNQWQDEGPTDWISILPLQGGVHFVRMEYYQNNQGAVARLTWTKS
ncbi:MAG: PA14 domain-containing protein, partial [Dehalococcoidia bacterium]|nr:PA14 domain-containing protein [Dehalococcoidia bacterium]